MISRREFLSKSLKTAGKIVLGSVALKEVNCASKEVNCVPYAISNEQREVARYRIRKGNPYAAGFDGSSLREQTEFCEKLKARLRLASCVTHAYSNANEHLDLIAEAYVAKQPVYILGLGPGANKATELAKIVKEMFWRKESKLLTGVVRILFHFDPTCLSGTPRQEAGRKPIPPNVNIWNVYQSRDSYVGGGSGFLIGGKRPERKHLKSPRQGTIILRHEYGDLSHAGPSGILQDKVFLNSIVSEIMVDWGGFRKENNQVKPVIDERFIASLDDKEKPILIAA